MSNGIIISGIGILSPIGRNLQEHLSALKGGVSGLKRSTQDNFTNIVGTVPEFNVGTYIANKKALKFYSQQTKFGCYASESAKLDARLSNDTIVEKTKENAIIIGAGHTQGLRPIGEAIVPCVDDEGKIDYEKLGNEGYRMLPPLWILSRLPNTTAGQISIQNTIKGLNYSIVNGLNSGIVSLGESFLTIAQKRAIRVICGGIEDEVSPDFLCRLREESLVSDSVSDAKPFSADSKGFACGEGAAIFIIEDESEAAKRDAAIYAEIKGYSNLYIPDLRELKSPEDIARHFEKCMLKAIEMAGISKTDVDLIQASAGGNKNMDYAEAIAVRNIFGRKPYITTAQSYTGNTFAASGAISAAFGCLQLKENFVAPILNTHSVFLDDELNYVKDKSVENNNKFCLINSFSYLGEMCSLIIKKR